MPSIHINLAYRQQGVSLVELMVSMVIALILAGAVLISYSSTQVSYLLSGNTSQIQETGRFAIHTVTEDIRLAGYWGLNVWSGTVQEGELATQTLGCGAAGWIADVDVPLMVLEDPTGAELPPCIQAADHVNGSDVIITRHAGMALTGSSEIVQNNIYLYTGLKLGTLFKADSAAAVDSAVENAIDAASRDTAIYPYQAHIYFIRRCSDPGANNVCDASDDGGDPIPTLVRYALNGATMTAEPVAEYVEDMQIILGEDGDDDDSIDQLKNADSVTDWDNVRTAEISLLIRAPEMEVDYLENVDGPKDPLNSDTRGSYTYGGKTALKTDAYRRRLFASNVFLRNDPTANSF